MKLEFLTGEKCPVCGTNIIVEESVEVDQYALKRKVREHVSGGKWERRKFICGQILEYTPNFRRTEVSSQFVCQDDPAVVEKKRKRVEARESVIGFIQALNDVDDDFKKRLLGDVDKVYMG